MGVGPDPAQPRVSPQIQHLGGRSGDRKSSALRAGIRVQASEMKVRFCIYLNFGILSLMIFFHSLSSFKKKNCIEILFTLITESRAHL